MKNLGSRRIEFEMDVFVFVRLRLNASDIGELLGMLVAEACGETVPSPSNSRVEREWERRSDFATYAGSFGRRGLPLSVRRSIYERDERTCRYCGTALEWSNYHCDHVVPVASRGGDDPANLAASCKPCNLSKAAKPVDVWMS